jgi:hypothetical protein
MMRFFPKSHDDQPALVMTNEDTTDCAWCLQEQGLPMGEGSHGICGMHARQAMEQYKAEKQKRQRH